MLKRNALVMVFVFAIVLSGVALAQTLEDNYNDLIHYIKIGRFDLATGYAQSIIDSNAAPEEVFAQAEAKPQDYAILIKAKEEAVDANLAAACGKLVEIIEQGRFIRKADPKVIVEEITRLSGTTRGQLAAMKRLKAAGEYAVMYMLDAMADKSRQAEWPNIYTALEQMDRDAIRPMVAALQTDNVGVKAEIIRALGKIGYPQALANLKYVAEKDESPELRTLAEESIKNIDAAALQISASQLLYRLAEDYYYHTESLAPAADVNFGNLWFWDTQNARLSREQVDKRYFNELMAMRCCEWSLKADPAFGQAIGLWIASFFKAESAGIEMPRYFGQGHADAMVYATTAGPEYLHQALARGIKDKDAHVALGVVEALSVTAGESSLFYRIGTTQPLAQALSFDTKAVRFSAAIAIANAGPRQSFAESRLVVSNLAEAITQSSETATDDTPMWNAALADSYALRSAAAMLKIAQTRNPALDLSPAEAILIEAIKDKRPQIQMLAGQILAYLSTPSAQKAVAVMALADTNSKDIRITALAALAVSAKLNKCLLDDATVDEIYSLVSSKETDPDLRSAAAAAYGSLNLPSQKVKTLILDQSRS